MKLIELWTNNEILPTSAKKQKSLYFTTPSVYSWGISAPIYIGYSNTISRDYGSTEFKIVILGFGFIYGSNWDQ